MCRGRVGGGGGRLGNGRFNWKELHGVSELVSVGVGRWVGVEEG